MVYVRANPIRYFVVFGTVAGAFALPALFVSRELFLVVLVFFWLMGELAIHANTLFGDTEPPEESLGKGGMDIFIDERSICGPVKDGLFEFARPEAIPFDAIDLEHSQHSLLFGSYLALKDGRRMIVSSFAHSGENVRRVFEEVRRRVEK